MKIIEPRHEISNNVVCATSRGSRQHAHTHSLVRAFSSGLNFIRVLATDRTIFRVSELKGGCTGSSEATHVKMPHCWKSHDAAHFEMI